MRNLQVFNMPRSFAFLLWVLPLEEWKQSSRVKIVVERFKIEGSRMRLALDGMDGTDHNFDVSVPEDIARVLFFFSNVQAVGIQVFVQFIGWTEFPPRSHQVRNLIPEFRMCKPPPTER